jgi:hypothetical protein
VCIQTCPSKVGQDEVSLPVAEHGPQLGVKALAAGLVVRESSAVSKGGERMQKCLVPKPVVGMVAPHDMVPEGIMVPRAGAVAAARVPTGSSQARVWEP